MTTLLRIALVIMWLGSLGVAAQQPTTCSLSAVISPAANSYVFQEPIRLNVTLSNRGDRPLDIALIFPYFNGKLVFKGEGENLLERDEYSLPTVGFGGRSTPHEIEPAGSWAFPIFLQTYYASLGPGPHRLHYSFDVPCLLAAQGMIDAHLEGNLMVRVTARDDARLAKIVANYGSQLAHGDPVAIEGLLSMDTPLVIPQLKQVAEGSRFERALQALSRFKGSAAAEQIALQSVRSKEPARQIAGLEVLRSWKKEIEPNDAKAIVSSSSRDVRLAALHYFQALGTSKNVSLVQRLLSDPDRSVADEARRTNEQLKNKLP